MHIMNRFIKIYFLNHNPVFKRKTSLIREKAELYDTYFLFSRCKVLEFYFHEDKKQKAPRPKTECFSLQRKKEKMKNNEKSCLAEVNPALHQTDKSLRCAGDFLCRYEAYHSRL